MCAVDVRVAARREKEDDEGLFGPVPGLEKVVNKRRGQTRRRKKEEEAQTRDIDSDVRQR